MDSISLTTLAQDHWLWPGRPTAVGPHTPSMGDIAARCGDCPGIGGRD